MSTQLQDDRSLGELIKGVSNDVSMLVRKEIELAKLETREEVRHAADAAKAFGVAALMGYLALVLLGFAVAWGLAEVMAVGFAFLVAGLIFGAVAAAAAVFGRDRVQKVHPVPEQTVETIKEDVQWVKAQKS